MEHSMADNPIVYASDGFVSVTGYSRTDVVPRNCRFLQGNHTDRTATRRLKASIENREETVELLLNYKKNGEPFWNLLYVGKYLRAGWVRELKALMLEQRHYMTQMAI